MNNPAFRLARLGLAGLLALTGCSSLPPLPGVYKLDIQQGNVITQDMIDQLRPGMSPQQVRFVLGSPLITDTFHPDRWDYLYSFQPGGEERLQERVSLVFDENQMLVGLAGDFMPGVSRDQRVLGTGQETIITTPGPDEMGREEATPEPGSLLEELQREIDQVEPAPVPVPEAL